MIVAISAHPESKQVVRFGHEFPVLLVDIDAQEVRGTQTLEPQSGCCRTLAERLKAADILLCTGVGQGAARHLNDLGISIATVPEGVDVSVALSVLMRQLLSEDDVESGCCGDHGCGGGHEHPGDSHSGHGCCGHDEAHHGCGCGNESQGDSESGHGCGCGGHGKASN